MRSSLLPISVVLLVFAGSFLAQRLTGTPVAGPTREVHDARRIVSLAPSITETLFVLGLGDRVAGVTRYCRYPPEAVEKPKVGGFLDISFEAIAARRPDLVIMLAGHEPLRPTFDKLRLSTLVVRHETPDDILASIIRIGGCGGAEDKARQLVGQTRARLQRIVDQTAGRPRPRVLAVIQRTVGGGRLRDLHVAGSEGFVGQMIALAGGENACPPGPVRAPVFSAEGVLAINPQVILDLTQGVAGGQYGRRWLVADWQQLAAVEAVRTGRVYAIQQDYAFVPGPRFILLVEDLARLIHPEIEW